MKKIDRRKFVKSSIALGGATVLSSQIPSVLKGNSLFGFPDIVTASASDVKKALPKLLAEIGGLERFVKQGVKVGILANSPWVNPGTFTHPDVTLSMANLCFEAGASEVICFKPARDGYWEESKYYEELQSVISKIKHSEKRVDVSIEKGLELKTAEIYQDFLEVDVYISIPVAKHHTGTLFSGNLKGLMGVSSSNTNRHMHSPDGEYTYSKHDYLSQCIADLNLIRQPDLCVMDAIECIQENGPRGPGQTTSPNLLIAGTDPVALDAYAAELIGLDPADVVTLGKSALHAYGTNDLSKLTIKQI
ncbi:MAG: DUF362 domain-containing protein [Bacteroidales bacterium]|nr:DUF362 domain-containing protein [Bacteroidales bacterium]